VQGVFGTTGVTTLKQLVVSEVCMRAPARSKVANTRLYKYCVCKHGGYHRQRSTIVHGGCQNCGQTSRSEGFKNVRFFVRCSARLVMFCVLPCAACAACA
jgi:hypothetical protein